MRNSRTLPYYLRAAAAALIFSTTLSARGADEPKTVISSVTVNVGTHHVTIQRVEPPAPVASIGNRSATPQAADATQTASQQQAASTASRSYTAPAAALNRVRNEILSLTCTRYECGVTEVRWQSASGADYRVLSSIDFNYLRNTGAFTDGDRSYTVFMGVGTAMPVTMNASSRVAAAATLSAVMPPVDAATLANVQQAGLSRYVTLASPEKSEADAYRGIDALHRHYDTHKEELVAQWQQLESERTAREAYEKEHPPQPKDTVIQFWPKKNSRYLTPSAATTDGETTSGEEAK